MSEKILYIGDTALDSAACYLAGVLTHYGIDFDYIPTGERCDADRIAGYSAFVISDYPADDFGQGALEKIKDAVSAGAGLFMPGGWDSFVGCGGGYDKSPLKEVLPVIMNSGDDRVNSHRIELVIKQDEHPILDGLDFESDIPSIGGYNDFQAKQDAKVLLSTQTYSASVSGDEAIFSKLGSRPLLAVGYYRQGRVAALATDLAPHWVGGLVDWGKQRVYAKAAGSIDIEVGSDYAKLMSNIVKWVSKRI